MGTEKIGEGETVKPENLSAEQEAGLKNLSPDFEAASSQGGQTEKEPDKESVQMFSMLFMGAFGILAARMGDHWVLSPQEAQALAVPTVAVLDKYYPNAQMGVEMALIASVLIVVAPRVMTTMNQKPIEGEVDGDQSEHNAQE